MSNWAKWCAYGAVVLSVAMVITVGSAVSARATQATHNAKKVVPVTLLSPAGATPTISNFALYVTSEASGTEFGARNGISIKIEKATPTEAAASIVSGSQHFLVSALGATATAIASANIPLRVIIAFSLNLPAAVISQSSIKSFAQLAKKKICTIFLSAEPEEELIQYGARTGVTIATSQFVVSDNLGTTLEYVNNGTCAAAWVPVATYLPYLPSHPGVHVLVKPSRLTSVNDTLGGVVVTDQTLIKNDPNLVTSVDEALLEANRTLYKSESFFIRMVRRAFPTHRYTYNEMKALYAQIRPTLALNGGMNKDALQATYAAWATYYDPNGAKKIRSYSNFVDPSGVYSALKRIGTISAKGEQSDTYTNGEYKG